MQTRKCQCITAFGPFLQGAKWVLSCHMKGGGKGHHPEEVCLVPSMLKISFFGGGSSCNSTAAGWGLVAAVSRCHPGGGETRAAGGVLASS